MANDGRPQNKILLAGLWESMHVKLRVLIPSGPLIDGAVVGAL